MTYAEALDSCTGAAQREYLIKALSLIIEKVEEAEDKGAERFTFRTSRFAEACEVSSYLLHNHNILPKIEAHLEGVEWKPRDKTIIHVQDFPVDSLLESGDFYK